MLQWIKTCGSRLFFHQTKHFAQQIASRRHTLKIRVPVTGDARPDCGGTAALQPYGIDNPHVIPRRFGPETLRNFHVNGNSTRVAGCQTRSKRDKKMHYGP